MKVSWHCDCNYIHDYYYLICLSSVGVQLKPGDNTLLKFQQAKPGSTSPACKKKGNLITVTVD